MLSNKVLPLTRFSSGFRQRTVPYILVVLLMLATLAAAQTPTWPGQQPPGGFPEGLPEGFPECLPECLPEGFPEGFPAGFPGGMPPEGVQGGFRGGFPGQGQQGFPGGPQGFGGSSDRLEIAEQFDLDGSGFLEAEERAAAKEYLASIGWNTGGRRGGGPGGGAAGLGAAGGFGGATSAAGSQGVSITPEEVEQYPGAAFYDTEVVRTIFVELGIDDWEAEMEAFYNTDVELPATVTVDGVTYENVGVRFRGNSSFSMVPSGVRRPLRLKFDAVNGGQNIEGVRNVKLLNGVNDASNLRTVLVSTIMQDYIEVPRVNFVRVVINGENWGVYQNQQHFNRDFLEDWYGESDGVRWEIEGSPNGQGGMLYLGDDADLYRSTYSIQNRDTAASWSALINLFRVLSQTPLGELVEELEPLIDIDGVLRYLALDVALVNSDGFWARASDYELYLDESGRFHMINHDINEALSSSGGFGGGRRGAGSGGASLDPLVGLNDASMPLRSRLLAVPELQKRYLEIMLDIAERWLDWETLGPLAQEYYDLIDADMAVDTRSLFSYEQFQSSLTTLRSFVSARQEYLLDTLPSLIERIEQPSYQPTQSVAVNTVAVPAANAEANEWLRVLAAQDYAEKTGPEGWHLTAGNGTVMTILTDNGLPTNVFTILDAATLPELNYAASDIPEGATYMRLSIRARNRSAAEYPTNVLVSSVSVVQGGAELVVNGDLGQP